MKLKLKTVAAAVVAATAAILLSSSATIAQAPAGQGRGGGGGRGRGGAPEAPTGPVPRTADGHPDLTGNWQPNAIGQNVDMIRAGVDVPMLPEAKAVYDKRKAALGREDPEARCLPPGVPRMSTTPYPWRINRRTGSVSPLVRHPVAGVMLDQGAYAPRSPFGTYNSPSPGGKDS